MDLLKKELERKKKAVAKAKSENCSNVGGRKYLNAGELRRLQEKEEEHLLKQQKRKLEQSPRESNQNEHTVDTAVKAEKLSESEQPPKKVHRSNSVSKFSLQEIIQRLRSMGLPIRLFGETSEDRTNRLQRALDQRFSDSKTQSEMDEFRLGRGHGIRNTFLERKGSTGGDDDDARKSPVPGGVASKSNDQGREDEEKKTENKVVDEKDPHKLIYRYFKGLLKEWEEELALRPESIKRTAAGKNETKTLKQCKDYIRPLFKLCKSRKLEEGLLQHIVKIINFSQAGEFVKAHDAYMDVAIGRAAWPIGVTMVGIHARSGRAKIESSNVAHVMNSELQRKYLTSVKRLMTYAQKKSNVAPSKKVMN